jgi:hypothetical protein
MEALLREIKTLGLWKVATKKLVPYKQFIGLLTDAPKKSFMVYEMDVPLVVVTKINGVKETTNSAKRGDVIFTGPLGEQYVVGPSKFISLYNVQEGIATPRPLPRMVAKMTKFLLHNKPLEFMAPWGESMLLAPGDYLVQDPSGKGHYRIEKKAFALTYKV